MTSHYSITSSGEREWLRRNFKAERLGSFEVDEEIKLGWLHHG
jgi:hypothetical protein